MVSLDFSAHIPESDATFLCRDRACGRTEYRFRDWGVCKPPRREHEPCRLPATEQLQPWISVPAFAPSRYSIPPRSCSRSGHDEGNFQADAASPQAPRPLSEDISFLSSKP